MNFMDFNKYQKLARKTAIYPHMGENLTYPTLGLCGETGEVAEKVKKFFRDSEAKMTHEIKESLVREMGDVLWYLSAMATELNVDLSEIAKVNVKKLKDRYEKGKLHGSGDNR
jgi:NTP pyrophosphatase (non-canonical NTP hydrolase)